MTHMMAPPCMDLKDRANVKECPLGWVDDGGRSLYIHNENCVHRGASEPVCAVGAIYCGDDLSDAFGDYLDENARSFIETLPTTRRATLRSPGGAATLVPLAIDAAMVTALVLQER